MRSISKRAQRDYLFGFKVSVINKVEMANSLTNKHKNSMVSNELLTF